MIYKTTIQVHRESPLKIGDKVKSDYRPESCNKLNSLYGINQDIVDNTYDNDIIYTGKIVSISYYEPFGDFMAIVEVDNDNIKSNMVFRLDYLTSNSDEYQEEIEVMKIGDSE